MSISPENYRILKKREKTLVEKIDAYILQFDDKSCEKIIPIIFFEDIDGLRDEISEEKGKIELGIRNLKNKDLIPQYQELLNELDEYKEKLKAFRAIQ